MPTSFSLRCAVPALTAGLLAISLEAHGQITLPAPITGAFQDFEAVNEGELPAGWSVVNFTQEENPDFNLDDPHSASYEDWVVVSRDRVTAIGSPPINGWDAGIRLSVPAGLSVNGTPVTQLMIGKFIYAESDKRGGSQVQYLFSPDFNCTGQSGVTLAFYSSYEQNQDNIGAVEYSVNEGASWLPIAYLIEGPDIIRNQDGTVDAESTLNANQGDAATYTDELGEFHGGTYGSFIAAPIGPDLGPFIQARVNDNTTESKRIEVYRLPQADNKAKVRLRFAQAGAASWFWGVDNIGLYSITPKAPPTRPTLVAPPTAQFFSNNDVILTGSIFSASDPAQIHSSSVWQAAVSGAFAPDTGLANPLFQVTSGTQLTSFTLPLERFFPGQSVQLTVRYQDGLGNKSQFAAPQTMLVGTTFPTLVPGTFEDFETTVEFEAPAGWVRENQSDAVSFPDWTVVSEATLLGFNANRTNTPDVFTGNTLYGASDGQQGNQIQYITTPEFNLTGYTQIWVAYKSNYMQNQDSFGGLEFTTNDGATWQPAVLMIDEADIIRQANGTVDPTATLTTTYDDLAKVFLEDGETRVDAGKFEDFILTRPIDGLGPFISGRVQDDEFESKRYQRYRVAGADNQAKVKFRFAHTGGDSWFWGIDDFGIYSFSPPAATSTLRITSVRYVVPGNVGAPFIELKWASVAGKKYTVQSSLDLKTWPNLATDVAATGTETTYNHSPLPAGELFRGYRVREQP